MELSLGTFTPRSSGFRVGKCGLVATGNTVGISAVKCAMVTLVTPTAGTDTEEAHVQVIIWEGGLEWMKCEKLIHFVYMMVLKYNVQCASSWRRAERAKKNCNIDDVIMVELFDCALSFRRFVFHIFL